MYFEVSGLLQWDDMFHMFALTDGTYSMPVLAFDEMTYQMLNQFEVHYQPKMNLKTGEIEIK